MPYICLLYSEADQAFARQLAVQLRQRGLRVRGVPDPTRLADYAVIDADLDPPAEMPDAPSDPASEPDLSAPADRYALMRRHLADASHVLIVVSGDALDETPLTALWHAALAEKRYVLVIQRSPLTLPDPLAGLPSVEFDRPFLLATEDVVHRLEKKHAPARPVTVEHPPPVSEPRLLPIRMPAERCWREDRLRINYHLPYITSGEDLALNLPDFLELAGFEIVKQTGKSVRGRRLNRSYALFDPRRAVHTLTIKPRKGRVRIYYRMTRLQVYHWYPAHYRVLDREAAALYRFLVTGDPFGTLQPVERQARRARALSWLSLLVPVVLAVVIALLLL